jgi:hypothetical protein
LFSPGQHACLRRFPRYGGPRREASPLPGALVVDDPGNDGEASHFSGSIALIARCPFMPPVIIAVKPELRSKGLDRLRCGWHVRYEFCGLSAEIAVTAENEAEARVKAGDQLRRRGLKLAV